MEMTSYEHGVPSWVDLTTSDLPTAVDFYGAVFGWECPEGPPEAGGYRIAHVNGRTVAGIGPQMSPEAPIAWSTYVNVGDADAAAERVEANGGRTLMAPMDVMTQGRLAVFSDPAGAVFGVWQPGDHNGAQLVNEPGAWCWSELLTTDVDGAHRFYSEVFGWELETIEGEMPYTMLQVGGRPVAGMMAGEGPPQWGVYFMVADVDRALATIAERGGRLLGDAIDSPAGRFAPAMDPNGAGFSPIQPPAG